MLSPTERSLRAKLAAHTLHASVADPSAYTAPARAAFLARFEQQVDPEGTLPPEERARRAEHMRKAHFARLAFLRWRKHGQKKAAPISARAAIQEAQRGTSTPASE